MSSRIRAAEIAVMTADELRERAAMCRELGWEREALAYETMAQALEARHGEMQVR